MKELGIGWADVNIPENLNEAEDNIIYGKEGADKRKRISSKICKQILIND